MLPLLLLAAANGVYAARTCGYDFYGRYRCTGLSNAARLGIGIGIAALSLLVFMALVVLRRRRARQINQSYIAHPNTGPHQQPQQYQPQPSYDPTYHNQSQPNQAWNSGAPMNQYAPPPGPPPPGYTPPNHPPPTKEHV